MIWTPRKVAGSLVSEFDSEPDGIDTSDLDDCSSRASDQDSVIEISSNEDDSEVVRDGPGPKLLEATDEMLRTPTYQNYDRMVSQLKGTEDCQPFWGHLQVQLTILAALAVQSCGLCPLLALTSAFSGCEQLPCCMLLLLTALQAHGCEKVRYAHAWSCEIMQVKADWIRRVMNFSKIFRNAKDLHGHNGHDRAPTWWDKTPQLVTSGILFVGGFSCRCLSALSTIRHQSI